MEFSAGPTTAVVKATVRRVRERNLTFLAGSLAYNAFVSLIPLLLLVLLVAGRIGDERLVGRINEVTNAYLTPNAQDLVTDAVTNTSGQAGLSVLGTLVLLWGALKLFRGLGTAFTEVYDTAEKRSLVEQFRDGFIAFVTVGVSLLAVGLAGGAFAYFELPFLHLLNPVFLLVGLSLAFLPMYYVYPSVETTLGTTLPGAVVAAGGWAVLEVGFQVYAANAGRYEAYGIIGGILLLVTWLYFSGLVLLVGAAVNAVLYERATTAEWPVGADDGDTATGDGRRPESSATRAVAAESNPAGRYTTELSPATNEPVTGATATGVGDVTPMGARPTGSAPDRDSDPDTGPTTSSLAMFGSGVVLGVALCFGVVFAVVRHWAR